MKRTSSILAAAAVSVVIAAAGGTAALSAESADWNILPAPEGHPLPEIISGYDFRSPETKALQDDDFENPGMLWMEQGAQLWETADGPLNLSCASCHQDAESAMRGVGAVFPKWNERLGKPLNLEQQINHCRENAMQAKPWKWESEELLSMTTFVRYQSRGMPVNVQIDGPMAPYFEKGEELYNTRFGQLDMACTNCHSRYGQNIRSDHLSQGQSNGFPTYRLKWQKLGSLHRRMSGCMGQVRATPFKRGSDEFVALEIYLGYRGTGLPVEAPSVRH